MPSHGFNQTTSLFESFEIGAGLLDLLPNQLFQADADINQPDEAIGEG